MEVNTSYFLVREGCPLCHNAKSAEIVVDVPLYAGPIWSFLSTYYRERVPYAILVGTSYTVMYCRECDFYWQRHVLSDELMQELYEVWIDPQQSHGKQKAKSVKDHLVLIHWIARQLMCLDVSLSLNAKVLDFGGGWGQWCLAAKALGCEPYLLELSEVRKQYCERQGIKCLSNLNLCEPRSFALINASQVFEHIPDSLGTLNNLTTLIKPGGGIHIDVPDASVDRRLSTCARKGPFQPLEHINGFTPRSLARLLEGVGFRITTCPNVALLVTGPRVFLSAVKHLGLRTPLSRWLVPPSTSLFAILPG